MSKKDKKYICVLVMYVCVFFVIATVLFRRLLWRTSRAFACQQRARFVWCWENQHISTPGRSKYDVKYASSDI